MFVKVTQLGNGRGGWGQGRVSDILGQREALLTLRRVGQSFLGDSGPQHPASPRPSAPHTCITPSAPRVIAEPHHE